MMTPKRAYTRQKAAAKCRGIAWEFTFDSWHSMWEASGHWDQRGVGKGKYVMARFGDVGPYSTTNVEIILALQNHSDMWKNHNFTTAVMSKRNIGRGRGWTLRGGSYQVTCARKYVGSFKTQQLAEQAYRNAVAARTEQLANNPAAPETSGDRG